MTFYATHYCVPFHNWIGFLVYAERESVSHVCAVDEYGGDVLSLGN